MLKIPRLDNVSYDKLFERARSRIPALSQTWTDFNHHDPGITTLQAYAWLVDTLNYYIDATGEEHRLKYLKLLGLLPEKAAARCILEISGPDGQEILIPRGTRIAAGDVLFELEETYRGRANRLLHMLSEVNGSITDLTPFAGVDGGFVQLFTWDQTLDAAVCFGFAAPLEGAFRFWVEVAGDLPRNPFEQGFSLSALSWEYFDGGGWRPAALTEDETCGFLRSGFVSLHLDNATAKPESSQFPPGHYLRCRLVRNGYDVLPRVGRVVACCAVAVQQNTYVQALSYTYGSEPVISMDYRFRGDDHILVAVEEPDGNMRLWYENTPGNEPLCQIVQAEENPWQKSIRFSKREFGRAPEYGSRVLVVAAAQGMWEHMVVGHTSGVAEDRLPFDTENLYSLKLALIDPLNGAIRVWELCSDIRQAPFDAAVFAYDAETREIVFGNGLNGLQPEGGQLVIAIEIKTSLLEGGHVRKGQVNTFLDPVQPGVSASNQQDAAGGKTPKTSLELQELIEAKLNRVTRAVNAEDYRSLVMRTPGLIIDLVSAIPMREYCKAYDVAYKPNTVLLAVKPYSAHEERPALRENYRRIIRENLERYRLLTANIEVVAPRYAGIVVHGRVSLTENTAQNREEIFALLRGIIDFSATREFGGRVVYGNVFSRLEMLPCVRRVEQISFEYLGEGACSNEQGDVVIYPDTLAYLREIDIEFGG